MNTRMWTSEAMQENLGRLAARGVAFVEPASGMLACGEEGEGRLAEPAVIVAQALALARRGRSLEGLRILVTAGPTREAIDPVRFISNRSSGRMGYAIAAALARRGATVTLVSGPTALQAPYGVERVAVETAAEMASEALARWPRCAALWMAAAVADFRPERAAPRKLSKRDGPLEAAWVPTEDILRSAGARKKPGQILVGFAAETGDPERKALAKLEEKNLDFIVANDVTRPGAGFDVGTNEVTLFPRHAAPVVLPLAAKGAIAEGLVDLVHGSETGERATGPASQGPESRTGSGREGVSRGDVPRGRVKRGNVPRDRGPGETVPRGSVSREGREERGPLTRNRKAGAGGTRAPRRKRGR